MEMIQCVKFENPESEELEIFYHVPRDACTVEQFLQACSKRVRHDFKLIYDYEIKPAHFTAATPDEFTKERILAVLREIGLRPAFENFALDNAGEWNWQECWFEAGECLFLRVWATTA